MNAALRPLSLRLRERRLNMRLMAHWQDRRDGKRFASLRDIDRTEIDDIWPDCFVIAMAGDPDPTFQYVGATIANFSGVEAGASVDSATAYQTLLGCAVRQLGTLFNDQAVVTDSGFFQKSDQTEFMFRSILLPLSDDQVTVNFVIGGVRCKIVTTMPATTTPGTTMPGTAPAGYS